jgi:hypothetical protein
MHLCKTHLSHFDTAGNSSSAAGKLTMSGSFSALKAAFACLGYLLVGPVLILYNKHVLKDLDFVSSLYLQLRHTVFVDPRYLFAAVPLLCLGPGADFDVRLRQHPCPHGNG